MKRMPTWLIILLGILSLTVLIFFFSQEEDGNNIANQYIESQPSIDNNEISYKVTYNERKKIISHSTTIKTNHFSPAFKNTIIAQYNQNNSSDRIVTFKYYADKEIIKQLAKAKIKLRFYTATEDGYVLEDATYTPDEYKHPVTKAEMMKVVESRLNKQAASLCVRLPLQIDEGFVMTNVSYDNTTKLLTYFITISDDILFYEKKSDLSEYCKYILDLMISDLYETLPDDMEIEMGVVLDIYEEIGVSMRIAMVDNRGNIVCFKDKRLTKNRFSL